MAKQLFIILIAIISCPSLSVAEKNNDKLGRLFTTASERHTLNQLRKNEHKKNYLQSISIKKTDSKNISRPIILNGIVKRTNGDEIIWINGRQIKKNSNVDGINLLQGPDENGHVMIKLSNHRRIKLKPGQYMQTNNGKVKENYLTNLDKTEKTSSPPQD